MTNSPEHITIIGCGFAGTSAFHQIVIKHPVKAITIFEQSGEFGPGLAYKTDECADYLLNNTNDTMCLGPDNIRAFLDWLEGHPHLKANVSPKGHLPRRLFGLFLKDVVKTTLEKAESLEIKCRLISSEVTEVKETANGVILSWKEGSIEAYAAIMTTGRCPSIPLCEFPPINSPAIYIDDYISSNKFDEIKLDAHVHIIGASLSAYDVINRLFSSASGCSFERDLDGELVFKPGDNNRSATLYSRSGRLKKMQSRNPQTINRSSFTLQKLRDKAKKGSLSLKDIIDAIIADGSNHSWQFDDEEIKTPYLRCSNTAEFNDRAAFILSNDLNAAKTGCGANFLVDLFEDAQVDIWDGFSETLISTLAEDNYRRNYETATLAYVAPCPIITAERILALHKAGRIRFVNGVSIPILDKTGEHYKISHAFGFDLAKVVINTTGKVDRHVTSGRQPAWVRQMVKSKKLQPYSRNNCTSLGASVDMKTLRPQGSKHIYFANMLLWGPGFFTSSAFIMATLVSRVIDTIFSNSSGNSKNET